MIGVGCCSAKEAIVIAMRMEAKSNAQMTILLNSSLPSKREERITPVHARKRICGMQSVGSTLRGAGAAMRRSEIFLPSAAGQLESPSLGDPVSEFVEAVDERALPFAIRRLRGR